MFKEEYRSMNEKLAPGAELNARTLARMEAPRSRRPRRALTAVLALLLAACLTLTAAAAAAGLLAVLLLLTRKQLAAELRKLFAW